MRHVWRGGLGGKRVEGVEGLGSFLASTVLEVARLYGEEMKGWWRREEGERQARRSNIARVRAAGREGVETKTYFFTQRRWY